MPMLTTNRVRFNDIEMMQRQFARFGFEIDVDTKVHKTRATLRYQGDHWPERGATAARRPFSFEADVMPFVRRGEVLVVPNFDPRTPFSALVRTDHGIVVGHVADRAIRAAARERTPESAIHWDEVSEQHALGESVCEGRKMGTRELVALAAQVCVAGGYVRVMDAQQQWLQENDVEEEPLRGVATCARCRACVPRML